MCRIIDVNFVKSAVVKRDENADKTTVGSLLSVCGSYGMAGAAIMSGRAALRSGIGLLKMAVPESVYPIMAGAIPEAVFYPVKDSKIGEFNFAEKSKYCNAILAGCGLSVKDETRRLIRKIIKASEIPMVFDADALNIISEDASILLSANAPVILTPHDREFSRLFGGDVEKVKENRKECAIQFAEKYNVIIVLKGHITIVASPDGQVVCNQNVGNAGMASGGSGDVLAGIISSLIAQKSDPFKCACAGVYLHALAGDIAKEKFGEVSMLPTDIIDSLPEAFKKCKCY